jgi:hypothetical protein
MNNALAREARKYAAERGQTFTHVIEQAVAELLAKRKSHASRPRRVNLPVSGDPSKKITAEELKAAMAEIDLKDDLRKLGLKPDAAS